MYILKYTLDTLGPFLLLYFYIKKIQIDSATFILNALTLHMVDSFFQ